MGKRLIIYGAGNLGAYLHDMAEAALGHEVLGYLDAFKTSSPGRRVLGPPDRARELFDEHRADAVVHAVGYHSFHARVESFERVEALGLPLLGLVHPSAIVDPTCSLGPGAHVFAGCVLDRNVTLEANSLLNVGCVIAHDSVVRRHTFVAPRVAVAGFCDVGPRNLLGIGTIVIDNITIAPDNAFGAASVVTESVADSFGLYVGCPARRLKDIERREGEIYSGRAAPPRGSGLGAPCPIDPTRLP